jgi:nucleoside-diphosphate-sugar epimerase
VSFGSYFEIGNNSQSKIYDEIELVNSILKVPNDYCVSKRLLTKYRNSFDSSFKYYHFILPTIYGELELKHRLIPYTVNTIRNGGKLMFSSGKQIRQYLYAGDIPKLIFEIFYKCEDGIYNIAGSETLSVRGIVETICLKYGVQLDSEMFGVEKRQDVFMLNLQLSGLKLHQKNGEFNFSKIIDILDKY